MQGYCVKCRAKREIKNAKTVTLKNGRQATQGVCPTCGNKDVQAGGTERAKAISGVSIARRGLYLETRILMEKCGLELCV